MLNQTQILQFKINNEYQNSIDFIRKVRHILSCFSN